MNRVVKDMCVRWQELLKQLVDVPFAVAISLFSIAVFTVVDGTLCLFSDAAFCSQLSFSSHILMVYYSVHSGYWKDFKLNFYVCNMCLCYVAAI